MGALQLVTALLRQLLQSRAALAAENLALRHQIIILQRSKKRPMLHRRDRIFGVWLSRLWRGWRSSLLVVQPETVIRWHPTGLPSLLALEVTEAARPAQARRGDPCPYP
jgi:hypothetical protein